MIREIQNTLRKEEGGNTLNLYHPSCYFHSSIGTSYMGVGYDECSL